jgi:hypothetical protein
MFNKLVLFLKSFYVREEIFLACKWTFHTCEQTIHTCRQIIHTCEQIIHTCEQIIHTCEQTIHTCEQIIHTCEQIIHTCEQTIHTCENGTENRAFYANKLFYHQLNQGFHNCKRNKQTNSGLFLAVLLAKTECPC